MQLEMTGSRPTDQKVGGSSPSERATRLRRSESLTASTSPPLLCPDKFLQKRPFSYHSPICDSENLHVVGSDISTT